MRVGKVIEKEKQVLEYSHFIPYYVNFKLLLLLFDTRVILKNGCFLAHTHCQGVMRVRTLNYWSVNQDLFYWARPR